MPETLIDPIPPTQRDGAGDGDAQAGAEPDAPLRPTVTDDAPTLDAPPAAPTLNAPRPVARSRKGCVVATIFSLLTVLAVASGAFYFLMWRYEPQARRHIPGDANVTVRLDAADISLFKPVRKHLWPLLEGAPSGGSSPTRGARIKKATGVGTTDLREILVASTDATSWVVLLGGKIPRGRFVPGLERVAQEEGWAGFHREGELLVGPMAAIGQAEDGTVAIGTDVAIVRAALPASDEWQRLGLPERGAVTFAVTRNAWGGAGSAIGGMLPRGGVGLFRRAGRASGAMTLGDAPAITLRITPIAGATPAELAGDAETVLGDLKLVTLLLPEDVAGEQGALRSARVTARNTDVEIHADWPIDGLDRACERLAGLLSEGKARTLH